MGTSHRQKPVKALVGEIRAGLRELFALPDGYEVALGNGGATAFWDAAAFGLVRERAAHLTYGEFSAKFADGHRRARPSSASRSVIAAEPGAAPDPAGDRPGGRGRRRRRRRLGAQRDLDRRDGSRARAPAGAGDALVADRRHLGRGRAAPRRSTRPTPTTSRRRRASAPTAACGWRCSALRRRSGSAELARVGSLDPGVPLADDRARELAQGPDLQHARRRHAVPARRPDRLDARRGGLDWCVARTAPRSEHLYGWAEAQRSRRRSWPSRRTARWSSARSTSTTPSTPPRVAATLRANGIVDVEPYRKLGRNQLRIGMFPAVDTADVQALTALHRLGPREDAMRRSGAPARGGAQGARQGEDRRLGRGAAARALRRRPRDRLGRRGAGASGSAPTTAS